MSLAEPFDFMSFNGNINIPAVAMQRNSFGAVSVGIVPSKRVAVVERHVSDYPERPFRQFNQAQG
jgi:hypothetical protein